MRRQAKIAAARCALLLVALCAAPRGGLGQILSTGRDGQSNAFGVQPRRQANGGSLAGRREVMLPAQFVAGVEAEPAPPCFYLQYGQDALYGPYRYEEGALVGHGDNLYRIAGAAAGQFSLISTSTGARYGPFRNEPGAEVTLGASAFVLRAAPPGVSGRLADGRLAVSGIEARLLRVSPEVVRDLVTLRRQFQQIDARLTAETQPLRVRAPDVTGPIGFRRDSIVPRSERDIARARASAERTAMAAFGAFEREHPGQTARLSNNGTFRFAPLPPGRYFVYVRALVRAREDDAEQSFHPAIWWATVTVRDKPMHVSFGVQDALGWRELFPGDW